MTCQDSFHEVAFNISFWTRNISSARILFWRGVNICQVMYCKLYTVYNYHEIIKIGNQTGEKSQVLSQVL